ncbi:MAG: hypothetical protein ABJF10_27875 [Chthoniobacter sp.]|uniref:hypothetical protein n=1 Tax=Chthoniobacter sp. TaxID=2510640 RepID=UPI0032A4C633
MSNPYRNGKIARLPKAVREEINHRLQAGATGRSITVWLNELPEVRAAMDAFFAGTEIREQNISEWKKGGYEEWLRYQEALVVAEHLYERAMETKAAEKERMPLSEVFQLWLSSRMVVATKEIESMEPEAAWKKQRQMCADLMKMRRAEQQAELLQLHRERLELRRARAQLQRERLEMKRTSQRSRRKTETDLDPEPHRLWKDITDEEKIAWARRPEYLERIHVVTPAQQAERMRRFFGVPLETFDYKSFGITKEEAAAAAAEADAVAAAGAAAKA